MICYFMKNIYIFGDIRLLYSSLRAMCLSVFSITLILLFVILKSSLENKELVYIQISPFSRVRNYDFGYLTRKLVRKYRKVA